MEIETIPKFSIIIPAYNASNHIRKALDSIVNQDFVDDDAYEIIVVCDSCEDDTEEIAKSYGARTFTVDFHSDGLTRNKGIEEAKGEWLLFMDDDDWWLHEFVLHIIDGQLKQLNNDLDILCFGFIWKHRGLALPLGNEGKLFPSVWNKCWKREFVIKNQLKFPKIHSVSDLYFHTDALKCNPKIMAYDMPLYYYNYLREGSISEKDKTEEDAVKKELFAKMEADYGI